MTNEDLKALADQCLAGRRLSHSEARPLAKAVIRLQKQLEIAKFHLGHIADEHTLYKVEPAHEALDLIEKLDKTDV